MAADVAQEVYDGLRHNPFILLHAQVWSRASTVQLVPGSNAGVQCFLNLLSKLKVIAPLQERYFKLTCI